MSKFGKLNFNMRNSYAKNVVNFGMQFDFETKILTIHLGKLNVYLWRNK